MNLLAALPALVGEVSRFGPRSDRIEGLIESQTSRYRPNSSDWIVLPWNEGFYLFSEDTEGQRRGRELLVAFLGPSVASVETVPAVRLRHDLPDEWKPTGLTCASYIHPLLPGQSGADELLARLEDMVATIGGRVWRRLQLKPTHSDLLRDFRLALLSRDDSASRIFDDLRLNGHVSAENLRYLRIEHLAAFGRWADMRALPHIDALLKSRRPQAISEILLQMVWWTELAGTSHQSMLAAFNDRGLLQTFGPLLRGIRVPSTREGRLVGFVTALADGDVERQQAILDHGDDSDEQARLREIASDSASTSRRVEVPEEPAPEDPTVAAFTTGRFPEVVSRFLAQPSPDHADLAVQAVLESEITADASRVLALVHEFDARGELAPLTRRARRDLEDLGRVVGDVCEGWGAWSTRLAGDARWADASAVARNRGGSWTPIGELDGGQVSDVCDALIEAVGGSNDDQLRASLDILCGEAALQLARGSANDFCQAVLMLLSEQDNFSEMVRAAYLDLFAAWLQAGPNSGEYRKVLEQTIDIWSSIASPIGIGWAISVLESAADSPCPDGSARTALGVTLLDRLRQLYPSLRERVEIEGLAAQLNIPAQQISAQEADRDLWSELDGKLVGIYSLLPRAKVLLQSRLEQLCSVREVKGNDDKVSTPALRGLAERADYLIVDTWHAAHQATAAIDAVRPKERQIFPRQRGISGFLRALEGFLGT